MSLEILTTCFLYHVCLYVLRKTVWVAKLVWMCPGCRSVFGRVYLGRVLQELLQQETEARERERAAHNQLNDELAAAQSQTTSLTVSTCFRYCIPACLEMRWAIHPCDVMGNRKRSVQ